MQTSTLKIKEALRHPNPELFKAEDGTPMSFHLVAGEDQSRMVRSIRRVLLGHGAHYIGNYEDMDRHTVMLVTDEGFRQRSHRRPAIKVTYVGDCILSEALLNINSYIHPWDDLDRWKSCNLFDVVFSRKLEFHSAVEEQPPSHSELEEAARLEAGSQAEAEANGANQTRSSGGCSLKRKRQPPSHSELEEAARLDARNHVAISEASEEAARPKRAKQTRSSSGCSSNQKKQPPSHSELEEAARLEAGSQEAEAEANGANQTRSSGGCSSNRHETKFEEKSISPGNLSEEDYPREVGTGICNERRHRGRGYQDRYRTSEKVKMLKWLLENKKFKNLSGVIVWKQMEKKKVVEGRSWQSLKNHFLKKLLPNLDAFDFMTDEQKDLFRKPPDSSDDEGFFYHGTLRHQ